MRQCLFAACLILPAISFADISNVCNKQDFLRSGLDIKQFQACQTKIQTCAKIGPMQALSCVNKVVDQTPSCQQTKQLAQTLHNSAAAFKAQSFGKLVLVTETFVADGKQQFFIVTPQGCMINTVYSKKYGVAPNLLSNHGTPTYQQYPNKTVGFNVPLVVTKGCMACPVVAKTVTKFQFDQNGQLQGMVE